MKDQILDIVQSFDTARFWAKVLIGDDCWEWTASKDGPGYGIFRLNRRLYKAHRISYELLVGKIPDGLVIDHLCRNRACVNPSHMEPVTNRENILRGEGLAAKQARQTHCKYGHPLFGSNLYVLPRGSKKGMRQCRECHRLRQRK